MKLWAEKQITFEDKFRQKEITRDMSETELNAFLVEMDKRKREFFAFNLAQSLKQSLIIEETESKQRTELYVISEKQAKAIVKKCSEIAYLATGIDGEIADNLTKEICEIFNSTTLEYEEK